MACEAATEYGFLEDIFPYIGADLLGDQSILWMPNFPLDRTFSTADEDSSSADTPCSPCSLPESIPRTPSFGELSQAQSSEECDKANEARSRRQYRTAALARKRQERVKDTDQRVKVKYACRKLIACARPREKGRFVRREGIRVTQLGVEVTKVET
mmetsp:Transcript_4626/g.7179  ORF Transcript_4626/g.7179 Transcript_4626/m.7179 type:complete len:156 (+) Transcript_4626:86-553(+)